MLERHAPPTLETDKEAVELDRSHRFRREMPRYGRQDVSGRNSRARALVEAAQHGDGRAREHLVVSRLGLVRTVAARYCRLGVPYEDLVQEGCIGLIEAVAQFDPCRGVAFDTFARLRIRLSILNALTDQARVIRLPRHVVERRRLLARATARTLASTGAEPTSTELAAVTGFSREAVDGLHSAATSAASLDAASGANGPALVTLLPDPSAEDPAREALLHETAQAARRAVSQLSPRRREIINRRFGLDGPEDSLATLARDLHLSERRARTIEAEALHELAIALEPTG